MHGRGILVDAGLQAIHPILPRLKVREPGSERDAVLNIDTACCGGGACIHPENFAQLGKARDGRDRRMLGTLLVDSPRREQPLLPDLREDSLRLIPLGVDNRGDSTSSSYSPTASATPPYKVPGGMRVVADSEQIQDLPATGKRPWTRLKTPPLLNSAMR